MTRPRHWLFDPFFLAWLGGMVNWLRYSCRGDHATSSIFCLIAMIAFGLRELRDRSAD